MMQVVSYILYMLIVFQLYIYMYLCLLPSTT